MSLLPGEITKHSLSTPASSMRSTKYSLTANGRSLAPSRRLPTGSNSLEKAKGWMRLPRPAAGMMPHMASTRQRRFDEQLFQLDRPMHGRVGRKHALACTFGHAGHLRLAQGQGFQHVLARARQQEFAVR